MASSSRSHTLNINKHPHETRTTSAVPVEVGDLIVHYLEQLGVECVFGIPGGPIEPLYNALARSARRGGPRAVVARHESGAAFMADGYARETGKLGVCCTTSGPGATNMITGVASAHQDNIPLLVITAQSPLTTFGRGAVQESSCTGINTVEIMRYCTKYSTLVSHIEQLEWKLASALIAACQPPMGPAHLSIPLDLLRAPAHGTRLRYNLSELTKPVSTFDIDSSERLCRFIAQSKKTVFLVGERCSESISTILDLAVLVNAEVVTTPQGKGLVSPYHPQFRGVFGVAGHNSATHTVANPDVELIIAIGTSLDEAATNGWDDGSLMSNKLVHVDSTPQFFSRSPMAQYHACGNLAQTFEFVYDHFSALIATTSPKAILQNRQIGESSNVVRFERRIKDRRGSQTPDTGSQDTQSLDRRSRDRRSATTPDHQVLRYFRFNEEHKCYDEASPVKPQRLMFDLSRLFPPQTRFIAEIGNSFLWAIHYLQPYNRRLSGRRKGTPNLFHTGMGFSSMGWAIAGAVGVAAGRPDAPVVCITGDGSFLMSGQEITVAVQEKLCVIYVLLNDAALGTVKHGQRMADAEPIGHELPDIDYAQMARAMGAAAYTINSPDDMAALNIGAICRHPGPTLLDVRIDRNEAPPLGERLEMLASGK